MARLILIMMLLFPFQQSTKRVLTVYTQGISNAYYQQQMQLLKADKPGLEDRDIVVKTQIFDNTNALLFKKAKVKSSFAIILTGKDGGEKYRSSQPVTLQKLYAIIDAMPMRKAEMRKN